MVCDSSRVQKGQDGPSKHGENALSNSSPCTINDQGTGSPRSLSNAGAEKGSEGAEQRGYCQDPEKPGRGADQQMKH